MLRIRLFILCKLTNDRKFFYEMKTSWSFNIYYIIWRSFLSINVWLFPMQNMLSQKDFKTKGRVNKNLKLFHENLTVTNIVDFEQANAGYIKYT